MRTLSNIIALDAKGHFSNKALFFSCCVTKLEIKGSNSGFKSNAWDTFLYITFSMDSVLTEKLTGSQLVKEFPAFYGTGSFITAFTTVRHLLLS
jgi:hypothetical protein